MPHSSRPAYVRVDRTFADATERDSNYLVFITPQGEPRGVLYVTQKTPYGFAVRESAGGHSTLALDYRIVAKPLASNAQRLPVMAMPFGRGWQSAFKLHRQVNERASRCCGHSITAAVDRKTAMLVGESPTATRFNGSPWRF